MSIDDALLARMLELAEAIQQIPAPTFGESQRSAFILQQFQSEGLSDVSADELGNVYGRLPGARTAPPLVVTAHLDTVFPPGTRLEIRRENGKIFGPGIGDNSLGLAGLFGLLWALRQTSSLGSDLGIDHSKIADLWFVANVCEEGLGDLRGMRAVVERFGRRVTAYLVLEGMSLGQVYHRALEVVRYRITMRTAGGHSWVDFGRPSAVHELATLVSRLTMIPLPSHPRTTLNVGMMSGGTSVNTIAAEATLELDLRSEGTRALKDLVEQVSELAAAAEKPNVKVELTLIGKRPGGGLSLQHPLVQLARRCLERQGIQPNLTIGSTDANVPLSQDLPAICVGLTTGGGAHTQQEFIHTEPCKKGLAQLVCLVEGLSRSV